LAFNTQSKHTRLLDVVGFTLANCPGEQLVTAVHVSAFTDVEKFEFNTHPAHTRLDEAVGAAITNSPTSQMATGSHAAALTTVEKLVPATQLSQVRSDDVVAFATTRSPTVQLDTAAHVVCPSSGWNEPSGHGVQSFVLLALEIEPARQGVQVRSLITVTSVTISSPGKHVVAVKQNV
jgi:hypothetical protein